MQEPAHRDIHRAGWWDAGSGQRGPAGSWPVPRIVTREPDRSDQAGLSLPPAPAGARETVKIGRRAPAFPASQLFPFGRPAAWSPPGCLTTRRSNPGLGLARKPLRLRKSGPGRVPSAPPVAGMFPGALGRRRC